MRVGGGVSGGAGADVGVCVCGAGDFIMFDVVSIINPNKSLEHHHFLSRENSSSHSNKAWPIRDKVERRFSRVCSGYISHICTYDDTTLFYFAFFLQVIIQVINWLQFS